jgi:hypothetical protein
MTCGGETADIEKCPLENNLEKKDNFRQGSIGYRQELYTPHSLFHSSSSSLWYCVPEFWCTEMNVINTEEIHIFNMPCKSSPPHAKVEVRCIHSWKALVGR